MNRVQSISVSDEYLTPLKVLLVGPSGVGKSALLLRYCRNEFDEDGSRPTVGVDFMRKNLIVRGTPYRIMLFDTAGQERFRTLSTSFYRGALGVIIVYDISSRASFLSLNKWFEEARHNSVEGAKLYLVGSKLDKAEQPLSSSTEGANILQTSAREVTTEEGQALAERWGCCGFCEVSAKTGDNSRKPFIEVVDQIVQDAELMSKNLLVRDPGTLRIREGKGILPSCLC